MIQKLSLSNFKVLRQTGHVRLGRFTLLAGVNGRGKSSFFQSLLLLAQTVRESSPNNLLVSGKWVRLGGFKDVVNCYCDDEKITIHFTTDAEKENDYELVYCASSEKPSMGQLVSFKVDGVERFAESSTFGKNDSDTETRKTAGSFSDLKGIQELRQIFYISADRMAAPAFETIQDNYSDNVLEAKGENVLNVIGRLNETQMTKVKDVLNDVFDGATIEVKRNDDTGQMELYLDSIPFGRKFRPFNVGYGYSYVLSIIVAGIIAPENSVILIENPEAHLHPYAQSRLMHFLFHDVLAKRGVQILLETHSDHVVNSMLLEVKAGFPVKDVSTLFFQYKDDVEAGAEILNLEMEQGGAILDPPDNFCQQYALDLEKLMGV